jgi:hypothetical protein
MMIAARPFLPPSLPPYRLCVRVRVRVSLCVRVSVLVCPCAYFIFMKVELTARTTQLCLRLFFGKFHL